MSWAVLGASVVGTSHTARNQVCQDACCHRIFGDSEEILTVVVADGAGSARLGGEGAAIACERLVELIESPEITRETVLELLSAVREHLATEAAMRGVPVREFACTLLVGIVGPRSATFAQIGDGAIVVGDGDTERVVFWPEPGEYANATDFLTDDGYAETLQLLTTDEPIVDVAFLTDGLQRLALDYATRSPHAPFFKPLFRRLKAETDAGSLAAPLRDFLDSSAVNERTDDDKTLILATRQP